MTTNPHTVTVTPRPDPDDYRDPFVEFTCAATPDAPCRNYPDKEQWGDNDPDAYPRDECWAQGWFDNDDYTYAASGDWNFQGPSGVPNAARTGPITITYEGDHITWEWVTHDD